MDHQDLTPDKVTYISLLKACSMARALNYGRILYASSIEGGHECVNFICNTLIDMYCKCDTLNDARRIFDRMKKRTLEAWNTLIFGYVHLGDAEAAIKLFNKMKMDNMEPGRVTFLSVLKACSNLGALELGELIHILVKNKKLEADLFVSTSLIDMYVKCGNVVDAWRVFVKMSQRSFMTWNTMLLGYALHGQIEEATSLFEQMQRDDINDFTFVGLLYACCHAGLVEEARYCFDVMFEQYNITVTMEHYCCMVDSLSRAGCIDEAVDLVWNMPYEPCEAIWTALLGACRSSGDLHLATHIAKCILRFEPVDCSPVVLLTNILVHYGLEDERAVDMMYVSLLEA